MKLLFVLVLQMNLAAGFAQTGADPVSLAITVLAIGKDVHQVRVCASLKEGWHIYSQFQPKDAICFPTRIVFNDNPLIRWIGGVKEEGVCEKQKVEVLGIVQNIFRRKVDFIQNFHLQGTVKANLVGTVRYQACTDDRCLPPKAVPITIPAGGAH
jgi:thiol:disulfide interchange protein DsbD